MNLVFCRGCGKEIHESAPSCPHCGAQVTNASIPGSYSSYDQVPWYRKSNNNGLLALAGFFLLPPLLWWACINCLTGKIYYEKRDENGNLKTWSKANSVVAIILLVVQVVKIVDMLSEPGT